MIIGCEPMARNDVVGGWRLCLLRVGGLRGRDLDAK